MKDATLRELTASELDKKLRENREELLGLRIKQATGQVENPAQFRVLRRGIARLETIKREKALAAK
jgi:large subunit ribosomal protein L29